MSPKLVGFRGAPFTDPLAEPFVHLLFAEFARLTYEINLAIDSGDTIDGPRKAAEMSSDRFNILQDIIGVVRYDWDQK